MQRERDTAVPTPPLNSELSVVQQSQSPQPAGDHFPLGFPETVERIGHEVITDAPQRQCAFQALDDRRAMMPDGV